MPKTATLTRITERGAAPDAKASFDADLDAKRMRVRVIAPGWGSSGYYSVEALQDAADRKVFAAGTHVYLDHPGVAERFDRPERSVRDLGGKLITDAVMEADGLYADIEVFPHFAPVIEAMAGDIGMSIRATAEVEQGEAEGKAGPIIVQFDEAISVDFVTRAGAGGKIVQLLESARRLTEATFNDQREALDGLLKDTYGADKTWVWVRDFDDETVWFTVEDPESFTTFAQGYTLGDDDLPNALTGDRTEVRPVTQYVPVNNPAGQPTETEESKEDTMANTQIEESALAELREKAGRVSTLESELATEKERADKAAADLVEANRKVAESEARTVADKRARDRVREANATLAAPIVDRIVVEALRDVPLTDEHTLDEAAFDKRVDDARTAEESYLAGLAEAAGVGTITGFGPSSGGAELDESDIDKAVAGAFGRQVKEA